MRELGRRRQLKNVIFVGAALTGSEQDGVVEKSLATELTVVAACNITQVRLPWPSVVGEARRLPSAPIRSTSSSPTR